MSQHILIVDDDREICSLVVEALVTEGFLASAVGDGTAMRERVAAGGVDLVVLDIMLPGEDGLTLCRQLRDTTSIPVIMLTAMGSEADRVKGLNTGADDYLSKPLGTQELLARIRAVLRRAGRPEGPVKPEVLLFAGWRLETARRLLLSPDGVVVELSGAEFGLLTAFLANPNRVLTREALLELGRGRIAGPFDRAIDVQVGRLRRKIETDPRQPGIIKTVRGGGYVLAAEVRVE